MRVKTSKIAWLFVLALLVAFAGEILSPSYAVRTDAAELVYSSVLEDLKKDENFDEADYPVDAKNHDIKIIQIAESTDRELLIYVYQPSAVAYHAPLKSIRFSTTQEGDVWKDYKLTRQSSRDALAKYKIEGFEVLEARTRYYNITAINRAYNKYIDGGSASDNHDSTIGIKIAELWTATTVGETIVYDKEEIQVVTITDMYYGTVRCGDGWTWHGSYAQDFHFVAFSTDRDIEQLLEADVSFHWVQYGENVHGQTEYPAESGDETVTVTYTERAENKANLWGATKRSWDRILSSSDFLEKCDVLDNAVKEKIESNEWVLSYYETDYMNAAGGVTGPFVIIGAVFGGVEFQFGINVSNVSILRLSFIEHGKPYNLGAVSNVGGKSELVGSDETTFFGQAGDFFKNLLTGGVPWWVWLIVAVVALGIITAVVVALKKKKGG